MNKSPSFVSLCVKGVLVLFWAVCCFCPARSQASVLAKTDFGAGFGIDSLSGQPDFLGSVNDVGLAGVFTYSPCATDANPLSGSHLTVTNSLNLTYVVTNGGSIVGGASAVNFKTSCLSASSTASRTLAAAISGKDIYASVVLKPLTAGGSSSTDLFFTLGNPAITAPFFGIYNNKASAGFYGAYSTATASSGVALTSGSGPHLLVAQFVWNTTSSKYDSVKFWLNPIAASAGTPTATASDTTHGFASLNVVGLFATNMTSNSEYTFDSLVIGTTWNDVIPVSSAAQIDPSGGAAITWANPWFTASMSSWCGESFTAVPAATMQSSTNGATILSFEQSTGFGVAPYQLTNAGILGSTSTNSALTTITTTNGRSIKVEWRSFNFANSILSAPDSTKGAYLVQDRATNDTMVSGTQGLIANTASGLLGGTYLTFDQNISQFGVVLNSNAADYAPLVVLFDADGVAVGKYYFGGVGKGLATYFGVKSPSSIIRSVWIGQNGNNGGLILDDIAFVPAPVSTSSHVFSFASGATDWTANFLGTAITTVSSPATSTALGYTTLIGNGQDSKLYRGITLSPGTYEISGMGCGDISVILSPGFNTSQAIVALNLSQADTWRNDFQRFKVTTTTSYILTIPASTNGGAIQAFTISPVAATPYNYDTAGMAAQRTALGVSRGMQVIQDTAPLGSAFFNEMKSPWKCNVIRYSLRLDGTSTSLTNCLQRAITDMQSAPAGLKFVIGVAGGAYTNTQVPDLCAHSYWTRPDLNQTYCDLWKTIVSTLSPTYSSKIWAYDIYNEPMDVAQIPMTPRQWWPVAVNILRTIRSVDANAWVIYESGPGSVFDGFKNLNPLPDPANRVIYSAHFYQPQNFTHQGVYESLANQFWTATVSYTLSATQLASYLAPVDAFVATWPVPVYVGEFSAVRWGPTPDTALWLQDTIDLFEARGWSWTYFCWKSWNGWCMDRDNVYGRESYGPWNPILVYPNMTDRGQVVFDALQANP